MVKKSVLASFIMGTALIPIVTTTSVYPASSTSFDAESEYELGVQDTVRIKVSEFSSAAGDVHDWTALDGDFAVSPNGSISMPLLGQVSAAGLTVEQLATEIAERLQSTVELAKKPQAAVEIVKYRPFYILGSVSKPGEYAYRPGITVLQAISIAGGMYRGIEGDGRLSAVSTSGNLRVLLVQEERLRARLARLRAELDEAPQITFPLELVQRQSDPAVATMLQTEQIEFTTRSESFRSQLQSLAQFRDFLLKETESLRTKNATQDQELAMLGSELTHVSALVKGGLAVAPREFELRQSQSEMQKGRLDLEVAMLRARQEISKTDQQIIELRARRRDEILIDLDQTHAKLNELTEQIKTSIQMLSDMGFAAGDLKSESEDDSLSYSIIRRVGSKVQEIEASDSVAVKPGDTIKVSHGRQSQKVARSHVGVADEPASRPAASRQ